jgi:hypothetical protein
MKVEQKKRRENCYDYPSHFILTFDSWFRDFFCVHRFPSSVLFLSHFPHSSSLLLVSPAPSLLLRTQVHRAFRVCFPGVISTNKRKEGREGGRKGRKRGDVFTSSEDAQRRSR